MYICGHTLCQSVNSNRGEPYTTSYPTCYMEGYSPPILSHETRYYSYMIAYDVYTYFFVMDDI